MQFIEQWKSNETINDGNSTTVAHIHPQRLESALAMSLVQLLQVAVFSFIITNNIIISPHIIDPWKL